MHRLLQAKNHQLTLWQPCGTWRTISKGVEVSHLIERNQRLCSSSNVFGMKVHLDFLVQPATVPKLCILCVYHCKVRVVLQRATAAYIFKWGEIRILCEKKFPSLCLYVYLRSMPTRLRKAESVEDSLLYQTLTNCWGGSCTMLDCKLLRYVVSMCDKCYCFLSWPEIKLLECLITSHPACVWMLWSWSVKLQMSSLSLINLTTFAWWFFIERNLLWWRAFRSMLHIHLVCADQCSL
jgi:hypothetical protein